MRYSHEQLNAGILIKALYENTLKGKNGYNISKEWWEQTDITVLKNIGEKKHIIIEETHIKFTEKGRIVMFNLIGKLKIKHPTIRIEDLVEYIYYEAEQILNELN